jgi:hypothetical protein
MYLTSKRETGLARTNGHYSHGTEPRETARSTRTWIGPLTCIRHRIDHQSYSLETRHQKDTPIMYNTKSGAIEQGAISAASSLTERDQNTCKAISYFQSAKCLRTDEIIQSIHLNKLMVPNHGRERILSSIVT